MEIVSLELVNKDLRETLLPYLRDTVFHQTTLEAYRRILDDGEIRNNKDGDLSSNPGSKHSHGRKRGWVCLFNLKDKSKEIIDDTLIRCYDFLNPTWLRIYYEDRVESNLAYLILDDKFSSFIIDSDDAKRSLDQHVQHTECWMKDCIPLEYIKKVLLVKVINSAPKSGMAHVYHMVELERQNSYKNNG